VTQRNNAVLSHAEVSGTSQIETDQLLTSRRFQTCGRFNARTALCNHMSQSVHYPFSRLVRASRRLAPANNPALSWGETYIIRFLIKSNSTQYGVDDM